MMITATGGTASATGCWYSKLTANSWAFLLSSIYKGVKKLQDVPIVTLVEY